MGWKGKTIVSIDPVFNINEIIKHNQNIKIAHRAVISVMPIGKARVSHEKNEELYTNYLGLICRLYDSLKQQGYTEILLLVTDEERDLEVANDLSLLRKFDSISIPHSVEELCNIIYL